MAKGVADHHVVDDAGTSRAQQLHAVEVYSAELELTGRCDTVEIDGDKFTVVEHKASPVRRSARVTDAQRVQLALQALCLREAGHRVRAAEVYFSTLRRRVAVELDSELSDLAHSHVTATRSVL